MITEVASGVVWDTEKNLYNQSEAMQELVKLVMLNGPATQQTEPCRQENERPTVRTYIIVKFNLIEIFTYNEGPMSQECMGLHNIIYTLEQTNNGA